MILWVIEGVSHGEPYVETFEQTREEARETLKRYLLDYKFLRKARLRVRKYIPAPSKRS